jgi:hypothetical protein
MNNDYILGYKINERISYGTLYHLYHILNILSYLNVLFNKSCDNYRTLICEDARKRKDASLVLVYTNISIKLIKDKTTNNDI